MQHMSSVFDAVNWCSNGVVDDVDDVEVRLSHSENGLPRVWERWNHPGDLRDQGFELELVDGDDEECPRSPPPRPHPELAAADPHLGRVVVTPDFKPKTVTVTPPDIDTPADIDTVELQLEYLRTLKRLARLMRRSDETRSIVKRHRTDMCANDSFFTSPRWRELELTRSEVATLIYHQSVAKKVFLSCWGCMVVAGLVSIMHVLWEPRE
jgi:hypothetical protein